MKCRVKDCERDAIYKTHQLCQKHYFRFIRTGSTELQEKKIIHRESRKKYRLQNQAGYQLIYEPFHSLADSKGYVYEHRYIVYGVYGNDLPNCELCGKPTSWDTCHIDHIDEDVTNNSFSNLRPLCRPCNTGRTPRKSTLKMEYLGRIMTFTEWAKEPFVTGCRKTLVERFKSGMCPKDVLFIRNVTHPQKKIMNLMDHTIETEYKRKLKELG